MTAHQCPCGQPAPDSSLCTGCVRKITSHLADVPTLVAELDTQLARQARAGGTAVPREDPDPMPPGWHDPDTLAIASHPLPFHMGASEALDVLRSVLVGWTRDITPDPDDQPEDALQALAEHLAAHPWRTHPAADEFLDELSWTIERIRVTIDWPPDWRYLGPCGAIDLDGNECEGDVYAIAETTECRTCGATHQQDERIQWLHDMASDQLVTASEAAKVLKIKPDLVRSWAHRKRITARGHDRAGRPTYRFGDCRKLAAGMAPNVERKGRKGVDTPSQ